MNWWYENEEEKMELYKNEDLCIECKNDFFSKPWDHRDPTPGTIGYCIKCDNFLIKEKKMEFDKSRCYSALNADELKAGDKVIVADTMAELKMYVEQNTGTLEIERIEDDNCTSRFTTPNTNSWRVHFPLAYLVERAENCTNCDAVCEYRDKDWLINNKNYLLNRCENYKPKTESCLTCARKDKTCRPIGYTDETSCMNYKPKEIDMWNYTSEKLPTRQEMGVSDHVVVAVKGYNIVDIGYYDYELEAWFVDGNRYPVPVYAWHYDKPPREA